MIKISYKTLASHDFQMAWQKLMNAPTDGKSGYAIKKIHQGCKAGREISAEAYKKEIMETFAKRDEAGKFDPETFEIQEEKKDEYEKAHTEFGERTHEIDRPKLTMRDIKDVKLTPADQLALEAVLDDSDAENPAVPMVPRKTG